MNCQRCSRAGKAVYRAYSEIADVNVCAACASEAWWSGLSIQVLDRKHQGKKAAEEVSVERRTNSPVDTVTAWIP